MQLAHRAALNGLQLDEIDPRIIIKSIEGAGGKETVTATGLGGGDGSRITAKRRESTEVAVKFSMNIRRNLIEERGLVLEAVNAWAVRGGILTVNYKPDRILMIDEAVTPGEGDLWRRLDEYTLTLRARAVPYWQTEKETAVGIDTATEGVRLLNVPGSADTVADAWLSNMSGAAINRAQITAGSCRFTFNNLGLQNGETLSITHERADGVYVVRLRIGARSVLARRTGDSSDELRLAPGINTVSFSAERACRLTVSCRGRFV